MRKPYENSSFSFSSKTLRRFQFLKNVFEDVNFYESIMKMFYFNFLLAQ